jgi:hypothetical protein
MISVSSPLELIMLVWSAIGTKIVLLATRTLHTNLRARAGSTARVMCMQRRSVPGLGWWAERAGGGFMRGRV